MLYHRLGGQPAPNIITKYDPPSAPSRAFDWTAITQNYKQGHPIGYGYTQQQAIDDLRGLLREKAGSVRWAL